MEMQLDGATLILQNINQEEYKEIQRWGLTRLDKKSKTLRGFANLELLDKLAALTTLPALIEARRQQLQAVQNAVDRERMNQNPEPLYKYPVKIPLYAHQTRACNMTLLTFGWVEPEGGREHG